MQQPSRPVFTLTLNPAIDNSCDAERVRHTHKTRTFNERMDPGGGGINVARVLQRFGTPTCAIFLAGGVTGRALDDLLDRIGLTRTLVPISGDTRMSLAVHDRSTGLEYRFVPEGPVISGDECAGALERISKIDCAYLVASGSLPRGVPVDFYARARSAVAARGTRLILDTSGPALRSALEAGGIFLVKPSRGELEQCVGRTLESREDLIAAATGIVAAGQAENVAVTLGEDGALLVNPDGAEYLPALKVETRSAVGAGDSFLAGMAHALASGDDMGSAFRLGMAAGAAAVLSPGSELCDPADVERLLKQVRAAG